MKKIIGIIFASVILGAFASFYLNKEVAVEAVKEPLPVTATPTPAPEVTSTEVRSADGSMQLFMKKTSTIPATFEFSVSGGDLSNSLIYFESVNDSYFSVPANSWSPDNDYFFIRKNTGTSSAYLVFKANGDNFSDGSKYIEVAGIYSQKVIKYGLREITGWDAPGLMHVLTTGPSYWFDLASRNFLQLATK